MTKKITVTIAGQEYTLVGTESADYVLRIAAHVDAKVQEVSAGGLSLLDSAMLAAVNITDEYFKEVATSENLRQQIKDALDESAKLKNELSESKREIFKLQNRLQNRK